MTWAPGWPSATSHSATHKDSSNTLEQEDGTWEAAKQLSGAREKAIAEGEVPERESLVSPTKAHRLEMHQEG